MVAPLGFLACFPKECTAFNLERNANSRIVNNGRCTEYFNKHLLFRHIYQGNYDNVRINIFKALDI